jgi:tetratricopeptide (TPR) repeat protein
MGAEQWYLAYAQTGENAKALALAEKAVAQDPTNAEMLLAMAGGYNAAKQPDKALEAAAKALEAAGKRAKPENIADADWQARKTALVARAQWMQGITYAGQEKWQQADQALRAALPGLENSPEQKAETLFYLGLANFRLAQAGQKERAKEALQFSQQCAAMPGPYQKQAGVNATGIRSTFRLK